LIGTLPSSPPHNPPTQLKGENLLFSSFFFLFSFFHLSVKQKANEKEEIRNKSFFSDGRGEGPYSFLYFSRDFGSSRVKRNQLGNQLRKVCVKNGTSGCSSGTRPIHESELMTESQRSWLLGSSKCRCIFFFSAGPERD
jgi:hypothetical protein